MASNRLRLFTLLNLDSEANSGEVRHAYRAKARELHPDKHPGEAATYEPLFKELQAAWAEYKEKRERKKEPHKQSTKYRQQPTSGYTSSNSSNNAYRNKTFFKPMQTSNNDDDSNLGSAYHAYEKSKSDYYENLKKHAAEKMGSSNTYRSAAERKLADILTNPNYDDATKTKIFHNKK